MDFYYEYFLNDCIIAEKRKKRPHISKEDTSCPFCNLETSEEDIYILPNKYPVVSEETALYGIHDVVIDTSSHFERPHEISIPRWEVLMMSIQKRWLELEAQERIHFIQVFKNEGKLAGASISHSHWQIIGLECVPEGMVHQFRHFNQSECCPICSIIRDGTPYIILETADWLVMSPEQPIWAYETWLIPKKHYGHYGELLKAEVKACGGLMKKLLMAYNKLEPQCSFNICLMSSDLDHQIPYHFHIKLVMRIGSVAGFEIATHCHINMVHPTTYLDKMKKILKE